MPAPGGLQGIQVHKADIFCFLAALHQKVIQLALLKQKGIGGFAAELPEDTVIQQGKITLKNGGIAI